MLLLNTLNVMTISDTHSGPLVWCDDVRDDDFILFQKMRSSECNEGARSICQISERSEMVVNVFYTSMIIDGYN